ncbi:palmitoyltransferase ZDHHC20-B isoform X2 [Culicoides brevitarsis]|uniref:palmitoyltransferase ZDHHC20-B isoform X2 n=1 Tax=Culicoides brevitarsis TaxID=469753 RepID=UPI00307C1A07
MSQNYQNYSRPSRRSGPCDCCVRAVKWIPVLFIFSIICWSYYAFVVQLCFMTVENVAERVILILLYHVFCFLFLWSYYQTIFVDIALVPPEFRLKSTEVQKIYSAESEVEQREILEQYAQNLPITNRTITGAIRFCDKCCIIKPDRAHHCSVCGDCVLKMDHHCPWVNNCVNFSNYKFFILFLGYALLYCIYIALASLPYFIQFWKGHLEGMGRFHILFLFFVSVMFAISLVSLFGYHIYLVLLNRTTLEAFRAPIFRIGGPDKHGFSLGHLNNFQEVFGDDKRFWFLPVFTSLGDGITYPVRFMDEDAESLLGGEDRRHDERATFRPIVMNGTQQRQHVTLKPYHDDLEEEDDEENDEVFTRQQPQSRRPLSDDDVVVSYERSPQNGGKSNNDHTIIDFA